MAEPPIREWGDWMRSPLRALWALCHNMGFMPSEIKTVAAIYVADLFIFSKPHLTWQRDRPLGEQMQKCIHHPSSFPWTPWQVLGQGRGRTKWRLNTNLTRHLSHTVLWNGGSVCEKDAPCPILHGTLLPKGIRQGRCWKHNSFLFICCMSNIIKSRKTTAERNKRILMQKSYE